MRILLIFVLGIHMAGAAKHTLQYFYTATAGIPNFPEFVSLGMVDGQQVDYYDSKIKRAIPKTEWMSASEGPEYWDRETQNCLETEQVYINSIVTAKSLFNQSGGVHIFQFMYGCELMDDSITGEYVQYGYDGEDFISFDKNTLTWTAANPQAFITKNKWDAYRANSEIVREYLNNECIEWLRKYIIYGKNTLERKDAPQVSLLQKDSSSPVICHATGFYPSNIMMTWKKNQDDHNEDVDVSSTLPNEDGSFQKSISLSVKPEEWKKNPDVYRCVVQHVGAEKEIVVLLNQENIKSNSASNNIIAIVVGCVLALAALALALIIGYVCWKKCKGHGSPGPTQARHPPLTDPPPLCPPLLEPAL